MPYCVPSPDILPQNIFLILSFSLSFFSRLGRHRRSSTSSSLELLWNKKHSPRCSGGVQFHQVMLSTPDLFIEKSILLDFQILTFLTLIIHHCNSSPLMSYHFFFSHLNHNHDYTPMEPKHTTPQNPLQTTNPRISNRRGNPWLWRGKLGGVEGWGEGVGGWDEPKGRKGAYIYLSIKYGFYYDIHCCPHILPPPPPFPLPLPRFR